jgi:hypothetical protein
MNDLTEITCHLPEFLVTALKAKALHEESSVSAVVMAILAEHFDSEGEPQTFIIPSHSKTWGFHGKEASVPMAVKVPYSVIQDARKRIREKESLILVIKFLREALNIGLYEAKVIADQLRVDMSSRRR